jgi:hypothetical protein
MAVFPGFVAKPGQTTAAFPVQKFYWKDPYARLVADRTGTRSFRYKVVPVAGQPGKLKPMKVAFLVSNEIAISPVVASGVAAVFNRGLISTQRVSKALGGKPSKSALLAAIAKRDGALRKSLAGDMIPALLAFVARAKSGGALYAALYELGDDELIGALEGAGKRLHLILSNPSAADEQSASAITDGNAASRQRLAKTAGQLIDRMFSDGQIGHNKYVVYVDRHGTAKAVLFGSTNWTSTGLCAQTNNAMVCDDAGLARRYLDDWKRLAADTSRRQGRSQTTAGGAAQDLGRDGEDAGVRGRRQGDELVLAEHAQAARNDRQGGAAARHEGGRAADRRRPARGPLSRLLSRRAERRQLGRRGAEGEQEPVRARLRDAPLGRGVVPLRAARHEGQAGSARHPGPGARRRRPLPAGRRRSSRPASR